MMECSNLIVVYINCDVVRSSYAAMGGGALSLKKRVRAARPKPTSCIYNWFCV
jgi:hypothetical protein